jgi:hypothetical protein
MILVIHARSLDLSKYVEVRAMCIYNVEADKRSDPDHEDALRVSPSERDAETIDERKRVFPWF